MITNFKIQNETFSKSIDLNLNFSTQISSNPKNYSINFINGNNFDWILQKIKLHNKPLILIDQFINSILHDLKLDDYPCFVVEAIETNKQIDKVLEICDFLLKNNANKGSMLFVIGGGIIQDLGAFASYMYKRGIPWTFIPTTLLSQADSCLGGKTAVNYKNTKNVLGLFSAPHEVFIDLNFIDTLTECDKLSGAGEIFRLLITGGVNSFNFLKLYLEKFLQGDKQVLRELIITSLLIKQSIVEFDEYEIDIRRSMNYGHSIGHAIEGYVNYKIPHGMAVTLGILVENKIANNRNMLTDEQCEMIFNIGRKIITKEVWNDFVQIEFKKLLPFLSNDKKAIGNILKLATLQTLGNMKFIDLSLDDKGINEVEIAFKQIISNE